MRTLLKVFLIMTVVLFGLMVTPFAVLVLWIGKNLFLGILTLFIVSVGIYEVWNWLIGGTDSILNLFDDLDEK